MTLSRRRSERPNSSRLDLSVPVLVAFLSCSGAAIGAAPAGQPSCIGCQGGSASAGAQSAADAAFPFSYSPMVAGMVAEVQQSDVTDYAGRLSGESPVIVGGAQVTLSTRNQYHDAALSKAAQYVYEFMQGLGLAVAYDAWDDSNWDISGKNVVGEIPGAVRPDEIVLVTAHLDDMPDAARAPGADDNASGSVGVMMAAQGMAGRAFERTVRFVFFTGEEVDLCGSYAYAEEARARNDTIVAVLNMDMIGWDGNDDGDVFLETRRVADPGYSADAAIATVFTQVVDTYGLGGFIHPSVDPFRDPEVDSWSFWEMGYPSITAIEDCGGREENPNVHTAKDTVATLNLAFFASFVQASVGTAAHLATPVEIELGNKVFFPLVVKKS